MSEAVPSWARVGAKVVCVDARRGDRNGAAGYVAGEVYTLSKVWVERSGTLACVVTAFPRGDARLDRFRPLVTLEDDITTYFAELLDVREPVEA